MNAIYPIGFMAGTFRPAGDTEHSYVRVGRALHSIGVVDLDLWTAAHASASQNATGWTRIDVLAVYRADLAKRRSIGDGTSPSVEDLDNTVSDAAFDRMIAQGLLAEVADPGATATGVSTSTMTRRQFAETHRFRGLLGGLGQPQNDPDLEIIGTPSNAVAVISQPSYGLWQLAGQTESLLVAAGQLIADASELGDAVPIDECLEWLLPDLSRLVSQGLGYFDAVPQNKGPLTYLAFDEAPVDLAVMAEELQLMPENRLLNEAEYRSKLSGAQEGLMYLVEDPETGKDVGYAGFVAGGLFDTIASMEGRTSGSMVEQARRQAAAAGKYPIVWHVQQPDDVDSVRQILRDAGITQIEVRHTAT